MTVFLTVAIGIFDYHYDRVENNAPYEKLQGVVENIYTSRFSARCGGMEQSF